MFSYAFMLLSSALVVALFVPAAAAQTSSRFEGRLVQEGTGAPVAGASVSIVGVSGSARTDNDGRFTWAPAPPVPFQIIVVLSGGQVARPVIVDAVQEGTTSIQVRALTDEAVTVLGAAPSINTTPGSATTVLSGTQIAQRNPENLMQALETVPGINQVSEGHAAVPAVRGLARGRTLFLIDGGRVTAERRVGPSGTFLDPSVIEGIDIARGPGSVAYGSDALGGVISVRTRRAEPGSPLRARVTGAIGAGVPEGRGSFEVSKGLERGGVLVQAHVRNAEDYDSPEGEVFNSGWEDQGCARALHACRGQRVPVGGVAERLRAGLRAPSQQLTDRALLLPVRELAPVHDVLRGSRRRRLSADCVHRVPGHLRAANGPGPLCHVNHRAQHRTGGRLGERLPRQGERGAGAGIVRGSSSAST